MWLWVFFCVIWYFQKNTKGRENVRGRERERERERKRERKREREKERKIEEKRAVSIPQGFNGSVSPKHIDSETIIYQKIL